jgi:adenylylsulfate kinase-like enzyme
MTSAPEQAIAQITGIQAAGKSTVAQMLAGSNVCLARVHLRGDLTRDDPVNARTGRVPHGNIRV